jgi:hypothetical protein
VGLAAAVAGLASGGSLATEGRGTATGRGVRPWYCHGGANIFAPILPNLVAPLSESGQVREIPQVDYVPDEGGHLAEEQDLLDLVHRGPIKGIELVH